MYASGEKNVVEWEKGPPFLFPANYDISSDLRTL